MGHTGGLRIWSTDVCSSALSAVLDTRSLSSFQNCVYLIWSLTGNVTFKVTNTGPTAAVISGLFFGVAPLVRSEEPRVGTDATSRGSRNHSTRTDRYTVSEDT